MEQLLRNSLLFLSKNKMLTRFARRYGLRFGASRFVAGETIEQAVAMIQALNERQLAVTLDYLGEFVRDEQEAKRRAEECIRAIQMIGEKKLNSQVSLKLTSMGLDLSSELAQQHVSRIVEVAGTYGIFVTIDMEDYSRCQRTLDIMKELWKRYDNVGAVLQAYLYRSEQDIKDLQVYQPNLRLVKGAYKETAEVAFPEKKEVDKNFCRLIQLHLLGGSYTAIATHDDAIIAYTKELVRQHRIPHSQFEFQMLYGIRPERQEELVREGYTVRVYMPYGTDWYGYFMRRLAERPANVAFVLKGLLRR